MMVFIKMLVHEKIDISDGIDVDMSDVNIAIVHI